MISHNLKTTEAADLIVYIEHGQILKTGTHRELIYHGGRYATLYRLQSAIATDTSGEDFYALKV